MYFALIIVSIQSQKQSTIKMSSGGQQRTAIAPCGRLFKGHPMEVNKLMKMHLRNCSLCKPLNVEYTPSKFNYELCKNNGWNGLGEKGKKPEKIVMNVFREGFLTHEIINESNVEKAIRNTHSEKVEHVIVEHIIEQLFNP